MEREAGYTLHMNGEELTQSARDFEKSSSKFKGGNWAGLGIWPGYLADTFWGYLGMPNSEEPNWEDQGHAGDSISWLTWGCIGVSLEELKEVARVGGGCPIKIHSNRLFSPILMLIFKIQQIGWTIMN